MSTSATCTSKDGARFRITVFTSENAGEGTENMAKLLEFHLQVDRSATEANVSDFDEHLKQKLTLFAGSPETELEMPRVCTFQLAKPMRTPVFCGQRSHCESVTPTNWSRGCKILRDF